MFPKEKRLQLCGLVLGFISTLTACSGDIEMIASAPDSGMMQAMAPPGSGPAVIACPATEFELYQLPDGTQTLRLPCAPAQQMCEFGEECCEGTCYPTRACYCRDSDNTWVCYYTDACLFRDAGSGIDAGTSTAQDGGT